MKSFLKKLGKALLLVVHDPEVQRSGKALFLLALVRLLVIFGASPEILDLLKQLG